MLIITIALLAIPGFFIYSKLTYNEFLFKHLDERAVRFYFSYDSEDEESIKELNQLKSPADLEQYLKEIRGN